MRIVFFFSSRRRHTRYWRDWSSDVCSSDLGTQEGSRLLQERSRFRGEAPRREDLRWPDRQGGDDPRPAARDAVPGSEERRVGKECRSRWSAYPLKKKYEEALDVARACKMCI